MTAYEKKRDRAVEVIRNAMIEEGLVHTPNFPVWPWAELPEARKDRWRIVAVTFLATFKI